MNAESLVPGTGLHDMTAVRIILLIILGLLSAAIIIGISKNNPGPDLAMLSVLGFFMLIVGPLWPSGKIISRWAEKSTFRLPTDDPKVAIYVANFLGALYAVYMAWKTYTNPTRELWKYEKIAFSIAGTYGVIAFWLFIAVGCLMWVMITREKYKKS